MRKSLFLSIAALAASAMLFAALATNAESQVISPQQCNAIERELLVNYDITGGTLTGPVNVNLQVYSNGEVKYSRRSGIVPSIAVEHVWIAPQQAHAFRKKLTSAGAARLCDQNIIFIADVPLQTLTVLSGEQNGKHHSFSFYGAFGPEYTDVGAIISSFLTTHIANQ